MKHNPHRFAKRDANHHVVVEAFQLMGAVVTDLSAVGNGVSDILVSYQGKWLLVEIKSLTGALTDAQKKWRAEQRAEVHIVRSVDDVISLLAVVRSRKAAYGARQMGQPGRASSELPSVP